MPKKPLRPSTTTRPKAGITKHIATSTTPLQTHRTVLKENDPLGAVMRQQLNELRDRSRRAFARSMRKRRFHKSNEFYCNPRFGAMMKTRGGLILAFWRIL
ncbi:hypothetical protein Y032_0068g171 [Ancylostoma ceylanicum]|uniref:Uncharacterized protein n=1 Tax=Ancylostoma ceylanicum TaxID=53326 RepID=A0A016TZQ9_9BILA|nr:hypothetical protein Y032_0068g171 [Ancylostoma ceylanicum]